MHDTANSAIPPTQLSYDCNSNILCLFEAPCAVLSTELTLTNKASNNLCEVWWGLLSILLQQFDLACPGL